jgi:hypothetical protein
MSELRGEDRAIVIFASHHPLENSLNAAFIPHR